MRRYCLFEQDEEMIDVSIRKLEDVNQLDYHKINMFTIAAALGKSLLLSKAAKRFNNWMTPDGYTLIELLSQLNDLDCSKICLQQMVQGNGSVN